MGWVRRCARAFPPALGCVEQGSGGTRGTGSFEEAAASAHPDWAGFPVASDETGLSPGNSSSLRTGDFSQLPLCSKEEKPKLTA